MACEIVGGAMMMSDELTAYVTAPGDPSVGIPAVHIAIKIPAAKTMFDDCAPTRELLRHDLGQLFGDLYDDRVYVVFSDEEPTNE